jgi:hypothetical protein
MNKLTFEGLAADVARTTAAAEANGVTLNWNEQPGETPNELHERLRAHFEANGITFEYTWCGGGRVYIVDGERYTPSGAKAHFLAPKPLTPREKVEALDAELRRDDLDPSIRASFIVERNALANLEQPRTGRATWGPRDAVEYRPRWKTDHHPWAVIGPSGQANGVRYAGHEVDED